MSQNYNKYQKCFERSVKHIFTNFLDDKTIDSIVESQSSGKDHKVWIEVEGSFHGVVVISLPLPTLKKITARLYPQLIGKSIKNIVNDITGEIGNMITGTFANQLQYLNHSLVLSPPEFDEDPIPLKTLYENISLSFTSHFGGFDAEIYFKD
jgi:CheY-specific phosphatase CheX